MDAKTDQEIVEWMASNTFINGESLMDKYPQIEEVLMGIQMQADEMSQAFNLDGLRATPHALYYKATYNPALADPEGYYFMNEYGECVFKYSDGSEMGAELSDCGMEESNPVRDAVKAQWDADMQKMRDNLWSYGFDPEVVNAWF